MVALVCSYSTVEAEAGGCWSPRAARKHYAKSIYLSFGGSGLGCQGCSRAASPQMARRTEKPGQKRIPWMVGLLVFLLP